MKISDTVWRNIKNENYLLEKYPNEEILIYCGDRSLTAVRAGWLKKKISNWYFTDWDKCKTLKIKKFCFIGGY